MRLTPCAWENPPMPPSADTALSLYLLVGQSNMAGRGRVDAVSTQADSRIVAWGRDDAWVPARDPLHYDKPEAGVGPGLAFAAAMAGAQPGVRIGLIPAAVGGSAISLWQSGVQDPATHAFPYDDALRRARLAARDGVLRGILWHQGEADRGDGVRDLYADRLIALVARLRADLQAPEVPFIAGELAQLNEERRDSTVAFNAVLAGLLGRIPRFALVRADGLRDGGDRLHLDAASARELGRRYAAALLGMP
jgi:hypothetical protein